jgi:hypothetical protein
MTSDYFELLAIVGVGLFGRLISWAILKLEKNVG